jgi:hypothetical protein
LVRVFVFTKAARKFLSEPYAIVVTYSKSSSDHSTLGKTSVQHVGDRNLYHGQQPCFVNEFQPFQPQTPQLQPPDHTSLAL